MIDPASLCQIELSVHDLERAITFYREAFGWAPVDIDIDRYFPLDVPEHCPFGVSLIPGFGEAPNDRQGSNLVLYFRVPSVEDILRRVIEHGGACRFGPKRMPGYGQIARVSDPEGNVWGFYEQKESPPIR